MKNLFQNKSVSTRKKINRYFYSISSIIFLLAMIPLFIFLKKNVYEIIENGQALAEIKIKSDFISLNMSQEKFDKLVFDIDAAANKIEKKDYPKNTNNIKNPFY